MPTARPAASLKIGPHFLGELIPNTWHGGTCMRMRMPGVMLNNKFLEETRVQLLHANHLFREVTCRIAIVDDGHHLANNLSLEFGIAQIHDPRVWACVVRDIDLRI